MERVYQAQAEGMRLINDANPGQAFLTIKGYEALEKVADGKSTKLIIPSNLQDISGTLAALSEVVDRKQN